MAPKGERAMEELFIYTTSLEDYIRMCLIQFFFSFGATSPILALAYLHGTLRFTSVYQILDSRQDSLNG
jgi:hypothetical protein